VLREFTPLPWPRGFFIDTRKDRLVNVTVENLAPCKKLLRVEVEAQAVDAAYESVTKDFQRHASLPGFRAGKAPREMILKAFAGKIDEEVKKKLIPDAYRKALDENKFKAVGYPDIEEIQFGRSQALQFAATVEIEPTFELPEYKGLPAKRDSTVVTDADIERALNVLREQQAQYKDLERPVQDGDFVVVNYNGTTDGKPLTEVSPTARGLTEQKNFWLKVEKGSFIPGFTEQLLGASKGDKRTVNVEFPEDFVAPLLAKKQGVYQVEIVQVKERILPALDDAFGKSYGAENLDKLREGVRADLQNELNSKMGRSLRDQLIRELLGRVNFDLPETMVMNETKNVVYNIVKENQDRGIGKDVIDAQKDQIFSVANNSAKDRVKAMFVLHRIAEKEGVRVDKEEVGRRVMLLAQQYKMSPEKLVKQLQERDGFAEIHEQILTGKVLDLLQLHAKIEDAPASAPAAS
jgi:trigger factor